MPPKEYLEASPPPIDLTSNVMTEATGFSPQASVKPLLIAPTDGLLTTVASATVDEVASATVDEMASAALDETQ